jgi:hypothetical protein
MADGYDANGNWTNQVLPVNGTLNFPAPPTPQPPVGTMTAAKAQPLIQKEIG